MKKEISRALSLTENQVALLYSHSYLNILNILADDLASLAGSFGNADAFSGSRRMAGRIKNAFDDTSFPLLSSHHIQDLHNLVEQEIASEERDSADAEKNRDAIDETVSNIRSLFRILHNLVRMHTHQKIAPEMWTSHKISDIKSSLEEMLRAIENHSRGRYRIVGNQADQKENDYLFTFTVESPDKETIVMPTILQDCLRDLIANSRKYTKPGGQISALLANDGEKLVLEVRDNGIGIPEQEIDMVVHFGYRGKNAGDRTRGGGFGLTKACYVTQKMNGRMWIDSLPGKGTTITLEIPVPAETQEDV